MSARTPFQLFKLENADKTLTDFNKLPADEAIRFKFLSLGEKANLMVQSVEKDSTMTHNTGASAAKLLSEYVSAFLNLAVARGESKPKGSKKASGSRSVAKTETIDVSLLARGLKLFGKGDTDVTSSEECLRRCVELLRELETTSKKLARSDPDNLEEPLRKSARLQAKLLAQPLPQAPPAPVVIPIATLPELSCAISAVTEDELHNPNTPVPKEPEVEDSDVVCCDESPRESSVRQVSAPIVAVVDGKVKPQPKPRSKKSITVVEGTANVVEANAELKQSVGRAVMSAGPAPKARPKKSLLAFLEKRPALTNSEKKFIKIMEDVLHLLAVAYARKDLSIRELLQKVSEHVDVAEAVKEKELSQFGPDHDVTKPIPFHNVTLEHVRAAIAESRIAFEQNVEECQTDFDEYLIHNIAHSCLVVVNTLEGFESPPKKVQSPEELAAKRKLREQEKEKKDEAIQKQLQKVREREEAAARKEEERKMLKNIGRTLDLENLVEDTAIANPTTLGYVQYAPQPLPLPEYERALDVWSMLVSVPRALMLSQFPFQMFLTALKEDRSDNGLIEEIFRSLIDVNLKYYHEVMSPLMGTPRLNTRSKTWFDVVIEFIGTTSGVKKKKVQRGKIVDSDDSEEDDEENIESDDDDDDVEDEALSSSGDGDESSMKDGDEGITEVADTVAATGAEKAANAEKEAVAQSEKELKETMERVSLLRSYATWGNIEIPDRLNLLRYMVSYALESDAVSEEADRISKLFSEEEAAYEKKINDARADAEKERRNLSKLELASKRPVALGQEAPPPMDFNKKKAEIIESMEALIKEARINRFTKADQEDRGARITPLGEDRYKRMYWRMPLDKSILVQTISAAAKFPVLPAPAIPSSIVGQPKKALLFDEEEAAPIPARKRGRDAVQTATPQVAEPPTGDEQFVWGVIRPEYLQLFVESLDVRGRREGPLKMALEPLVDYLKHLEAPHEGVRMTRSRAAANGYLNKLRAV